MSAVNNCTKTTNASYLTEGCVLALLATAVSVVAWCFFHAHDTLTTVAFLNGIQLSCLSGVFGILALHRIYLGFRSRTSTT
ncbi:MAG: hypothetical protein JSS62_02825 [Verrucomicrobia bacterium]|nr:hypothetical protein [Verrucomicrobiota bacterium]